MAGNLLALGDGGALFLFQEYRRLIAMAAVVLVSLAALLVAGLAGFLADYVPLTVWVTMPVTMLAIAYAVFLTFDWRD